MTLRPSPLILAIDLGTSGAKVGLVSRGGHVVASSFERTRLKLLPGGGAEQDPDDWWRAVTTAARRVVATAGPPRSVAAVACTGQWSGTVPVDAAGRHLGPALIWMDARGARLVARTVHGPVRVKGYDVRKLLRWVRLTGGAPERSGKDPVAHILWIANNRPAIYDAAAAFLEPKDYLNARLTGRLAAGFDSIALHWVTDNRRVDRVRYDPRLIAMVGLDVDKLPPLRPPTDVLGALQPQAAEELGLLPGTPVVMGAPDMHAAAVGSGATADYQAHLYLGTSSWLLCHVPYKKTDIAHNLASLPSSLPGRWLVVNEQETAGAALTFLARNLRLPAEGVAADAGLTEMYAGYDRMAEHTPPGSSGVLFTPWLYGERTPVEHATLRGSFVNLSLDTTRRDMVRAVLEGVALNTRWLLAHVERFIGRRIDAIRIVGGGAASRTWCQIHADALDRTLHQVAAPELVSLRGAALLGFLSLGVIGIDEIGGDTETTETFRPGPASTAVYDRLFREFLRQYRSSRGMHDRLVGD